MDPDWRHSAAPAEEERLKTCRILFGTHEIGGQMQLMVEELRRRGYTATAASYGREWFGHVNDVNLDIRLLKSGFRKHLNMGLFAAWAGINYDIFHFFWGQSLYGVGGMSHLDLPLLRRTGKKIFVHFRGLDIIDVAYFDYLRSKTAGETVPEPPLSRPEQLRSLQKWRRYAHKILVSEPDLFRVVPEAELVQQAINLADWEADRTGPKSAEDGVIRIVHAPSLRRKKGTEFVERSVEELKELGYKVELLLVEKAPFNRMKELYEMADIGVDQVLYGWYGKVSIELMALGRPVVCYIDPELLRFRSDMPIVNADPFTLTARLRELIDAPRSRDDLGTRGRSYVAQYHDVGRIIDQCVDIYRSAL